MAQAIWSGAIAFGLVNVPVQMFPATTDRSVRFHQFERGTTSRIRYRRINEDTGEEVPFRDIVKGYELDDGDWVMLEPDELEAVEPVRSRTIEITDFVDATEIDPIHFEKSYYLSPKDETAVRAYGLLARAMADSGRTAVATFVMRSKQYLAAIRPVDGVLTLETLFYEDEVRAARDVVTALPENVEIAERDLDTAVTLIEAMTTAWDPSNYRDTYRDRVLELIEAKRAGREIVARADEPETAGVIDLMAKLQQSVAAARGKRPGHPVDSADGGDAPDSTVDDGTAEAGSDELDDLAKSELYDLAKELGVTGRSSMTKEELVEAIRVARAGRRAS